MPNVNDACNNNYCDATSSSISSLIKLKLDNIISGTMPSNLVNLKSLEVLHLLNNLLRDSLSK